MKKVCMMILFVALFAFAMSTIAAYAIADEVVEQPAIVQEQTKGPEVLSVPKVTQTDSAVIIQQPSVTIDLTGIVLAIIGVLGSIAISYVIPMLKTERAKKLAVIAVQAAEQLFTTGVIDDKLEYAEKWLEEHGVKTDRRVLIESAVAELNKFKKELEYESEIQNPPDIDICDEVDGCSVCEIDLEEKKEVQPTEEQEV